MSQRISSALLAVMVWVLSSQAFAFPTPRLLLDYRPLPASLTANYHFDGIVALSNCSGSIIRLENGVSTDKAMILTNGHCFEGGMPAPGKFASHTASNRSFNVLNDQSQGMGSVHASEVLYSTMTGTDITLYKLQETYAEIEQKFGAHPMTLSSKHPSTGTSIEVISGYWKKGYSCKVEAFVNELREANWSMLDSIRYSRPGCEIIGGTSGSPVVEAGTRTVIGINNTVNESGEQCTFDNPCEVDKAGNITAELGRGYAQETYQIYTCIDKDRNFDLATPGCQLFHQ